MQHSPAIDALSAALGAEPSLQDSPRLAVWEFDPAADGVGLLRSARPSVHSLTGQLNTILTMVEKRRLRLRWVVAYVGPDSSRAAAEWLAARPENEAPTWAAWASLDRLARTPDQAVGLLERLRQSEVVLHLPDLPECVNHESSLVFVELMLSITHFEHRHVVRRLGNGRRATEGGVRTDG